jgi:hypothetical protein
MADRTGDGGALSQLISFFKWEAGSWDLILFSLGIVENALKGSTIDEAR